MLIDFMNIFSQANKSSKNARKRLSDSLRFIEKKNKYLTFLIRRFFTHLKKSFHYKEHPSPAGKEVVYLVDKADYIFGKKFMEKLESKPPAKVILMREGSGIFEFMYGHQKLGKSIALQLIRSLGGKKIILLSKRDFCFLKFMAEQNKIKANLSYPAKIIDNLAIFGTSNLYYNAFKQNIAKNALAGLPLAKINDISQYSEIKCWKKQNAQQ
jgi:hypothetical protein